MQAELEEVLSLQEEWTAENTEAMKRRGDLIRNKLRQQIGEILPDLQAVDPTLSDGAIEGRDGMAKSELPWTRFYSFSRSPSATKGWYIVYLFSAHGDRVYVSLNQGHYPVGGRLLQAASARRARRARHLGPGSAGLPRPGGPSPGDLA